MPRWGLLCRGDKVAIHWWYYPDSYDELVVPDDAPELVEPDKQADGDHPLSGVYDNTIAAFELITGAARIEKFKGSGGFWPGPLRMCAPVAPG